MLRIKEVQNPTDPIFIILADFTNFINDIGIFYDLFP